MLLFILCVQLMMNQKIFTHISDIIRFLLLGWGGGGRTRTIKNTLKNTNKK